MSTETNKTPKKSFLTRAMENVRDKQDGEWYEVDEQGARIEKKITRKQILIRVGATAVVGTAAVYAALKLFNGQAEETTETENESID